MYARVLAAFALALLSTAAAPALAGNYAYFDRPEAANLNSHAAVSNDSYVRAFGWTWGDLQFKQEPGTPQPPQPPERQARDNLTDPHGLAPGRLPHDDSAPPRGRRGKVSMS
ncbi:MULTISPECIES: hypothetical protein [Cupriavidus]|uniref:Uncharacterized protein n=1 Tax=Cupriavidus pauculus TaxID=82633 RepID=A0A3G8H669_9BURK|nr:MULTISPECIES: hypothetical protein [Cupriavidus]AZG16053.1 hypothetical protein EHF44_21765 [Cupriavidus pauculus]MDT6963890.1 hypothetical protein [Cupriavidus sp. SZY C1]